MNKKSYYVYIITNKYNDVFYIGVTNDLSRRVEEHANKQVKGFTEKYNVYKLVYFETYDDVRNAIAREKKLKKWRREWKIALITKENAKYEDLMLSKDIVLY